MKAMKFILIGTLCMAVVSSRVTISRVTLSHANHPKHSKSYCYKGEILLIITNKAQTPFVIENSMRLAQLVILPYAKVDWSETNTLFNTSRGDGGFGSTGLQ